MAAPARVLLFTGKGGVGKTTTAAATALACADAAIPGASAWARASSMHRRSRSSTISASNGKIPKLQASAPAA